MKPGEELDRLVALVLGKVEGVDFGDFGEHEWKWNEYSEYNTYYCSKCDKESEEWAYPKEPPKEGCHKTPHDYSTSSFWIMAKDSLWEWLEDNHPWGPRVHPSLCRELDSKEPAVMLWETGELGEVEAYRVIVGETYPHAICLAILETAKK